MIFWFKEKKRSIRKEEKIKKLFLRFKNLFLFLQNHPSVFFHYYYIREQYMLLPSIAIQLSKNQHYFL